MNLRQLITPLLLTLILTGCSEKPDSNPPSEPDPEPEMTPEVEPPQPHTVSCEAPEALSVPEGLTASVTLQCTLSETPTEAISEITLSIASPFEASLLPDPDLGAGGGFGIEVRFTPTQTGPAQATLQITYTSLEQTLTHEVEIQAQATPGLDWDPDFVPPPCRAEGEAPLLDQTLAQTGLDRETFTFSEDDLRSSTYFTGGFLDDEFLLSWFEAMRAQPARSGCFEGEVVGAMDHHLAQPHPIAGMVRHAARILDLGPDEARPFNRAALPGDFDAAMALICAAGQEACGPPRGELPAELTEALTPLMWAILEGIEARLARDAASPRGPDWWQQNGGHGVLITTNGEVYDLNEAADRGYLIGQGDAGRGRLYRAASQIAFAIEDIDWTPFVGMMGVRFSLKTPFGTLLVRDGGNTLYTPDGIDLLLHIDLGGNDTYQGEVASNRSGSNPVSLHIDLGGDDNYTYISTRTPHDDNEALLPADAGGRYRGDDLYGPVSLSTLYRQGAARNGIAMLFDLGEGNDRYNSLIASQGYAHQGVGVLFDAGGDDLYLSEAGSQGAAQFGIALSVDAGAGQDRREAYTLSQGFGYVGGAGFLVDGGGDDLYKCDHGDPELGGNRLYYTPQLPQNGNSSFCQGAGFGRRGQQTPAEHLSGGLGVLRDVSGDDDYEASVFAQGTGYWQGTGILSDGDGSDVYNAYWYIQGGAAHYAVGILADGGEGDDLFNPARPTRNVTLGSGHDYSLGILISEGGDDEYHLTSLSAGASNCNGIGLFVDNGGDDRYIARTDYSSGMGNVSGECLDARPDAVSIGIMIDAGGTDTYEYPESEYPLPGDGQSWGHKRNDLDSEHGAGLDAEGESGIHAESGAP